MPRIKRAVRAIAKRCRLPEETIMDAFTRKPITFHAAGKISEALNIPVSAFRTHNMPIRISELLPVINTKRTRTHRTTKRG